MRKTRRLIKAHVFTVPLFLNFFFLYNVIHFMFLCHSCHWKLQTDVGIKLRAETSLKYLICKMISRQRTLEEIVFESLQESNLVANYMATFCRSIWEAMHHFFTLSNGRTIPTQFLKSNFSIRWRMQSADISNGRYRGHVYDHPFVTASKMWSFAPGNNVSWCRIRCSD